MKRKYKYCIQCNKKKPIKSFRKIWCGLRACTCRSCNKKNGEYYKDYKK